jgi:hypothetical protein
VSVKFNLSLDQTILRSILYVVCPSKAYYISAYYSVYSSLQKIHISHTASNKPRILYVLFCHFTPSPPVCVKSPNLENRQVTLVLYVVVLALQVEMGLHHWQCQDGGAQY